MTKRLLLVLGVWLSASGAFGLGLAYGGGGAFRVSPVTFDGTYSSAATSVTSRVSVAARQFFDLTYVMFEIGYTLNRGSTEPTSASTTTAFAAVVTGVSFGVSVKYPFELGPVAIFPLAGVEYVRNLSYADDKGNNLKSMLAGPPSALDELWVKGGIGMDIYLGPIFLRPLVQAGFKPLLSGGGSSWTSPHSTGSITIGLSSFTVDIDLLVGVKF
jgi:hypothetical protein